MSQFQIKHNHILYTLTGSLLLFSTGFLVLSFLHPLITENSHAESKDVGTNVNLEETLPLPSVSPSSVALTLEPNAAGDFDSAAVTVGVSTNHVSGYTLTMNTVGTSTDLSHDSSSDYKIEALSAKTSATDFANLSSTASINKWGFATDNNGSGTGQTDAGYYYPVTNSENPTTIKVTDGPANVSDTQVTFATKGKDLAAGTYSNTVIFTTIANAIPEPKIYMQDMDANACAALDQFDATNETTIANTTYTVYDSRDESDYTIRKLADGHCWMAQNLRLTADTLSAANHSTTLTSADTDINDSTADFVMPSNAKWSAASASAGKLVKGAADATKLPVGSSSGAAASGETAIARGAYYSWCTATADCSADPGTGKQQPSSICPKSWRLANPNNGSSTNANEYYKLYNAYGSASSFNQAFNTYYSSGASYYLAGFWSASSSNQYVNFAGSYSYWWSSTSHSSNANFAWLLYASTSSVYPADYSSRYVGGSVRCVL